MIYVSNFTNQKAELCPEVVNVNTSYTVTRDDNGAFFRCSSQNDLSPDPGPSKDSSKISVICMYKNNFLHFIIFLIVEFQPFHQNNVLSKIKLKVKCDGYMHFQRR